LENKKKLARLCLFSLPFGTRYRGHLNLVQWVFKVAVIEEDGQRYL